MTNIEKCPCENCICVPICRHKLYAFLFRDCILLKDHISKYHVESERNPYKIEQLEKTLNPTLWTYEYCIDLNQYFKMIVDRNTLRPRV
jgi:hypothetical protein